MTLSDDTVKAVEDVRRRLAARSPESNRHVADELRRLAKEFEPDARLRIEQFAREFEARADGVHASSSSVA